VSTYWQIREHVVDPVVGAVASGFDTLVTRTSDSSRDRPPSRDTPRED